MVYQRGKTHISSYRCREPYLMLTCRPKWTLQELIAPEEVRFYDKEWKYLGDKRTLLKLLANATRIDENTLVDPDNLHRCTIARRMSWASERETTRIEDIAYSLLGIFDVNMPLLYGEGNRAFIRLQEEIMKSSNDQTVFAWHNEK